MLCWKVLKVRQIRFDSMVLGAAHSTVLHIVCNGPSDNAPPSFTLIEE